MDFIKDNDEVTIDPSAVRVKSHEHVTTDRDRIMTTIDSSNITIFQREVRNTIDNDIIDVSAAHFHIGLDGIDISGYEIDEYTKLSGGHLEFAKNAKISTNNLDVCLNTLDIAFTSQDYLDKIGVTREQIGNTNSNYYYLDNFLKINKGLYYFQNHREGYIDDIKPIVYDDSKLILTCQDSGSFLFIFIEFRLTEGDIDTDNLQANSNGDKTSTPYWNKDTTTGVYWRHYMSKYFTHSPRSKESLDTLIAGTGWSWGSLTSTAGYLLTGQIPFTIIKHADILTVESNKIQIQGNYLDFTNNGEISTHNQLNTLPIDFTDINYLNALGIKRKQVGSLNYYELLNFLDFKGYGGSANIFGLYVYDANKLIIVRKQTNTSNEDYFALIYVEFRLMNGENYHERASLYTREWTHDLTSGFWWRHYDSRVRDNHGTNVTKEAFEQEGVGATHLGNPGWVWDGEDGWSATYTSEGGFLTLYNAQSLRFTPLFTILKSINSKLSLNNDNVIVNGAMGIGTSIPTAPLTIYNNPSNYHGSETLRLVGATVSGNGENRGYYYAKQGPFISFNSIIDYRVNNIVNNEFKLAGISAVDNDRWGGDLVFYTNGMDNNEGGSHYLEERMRICQNGKTHIKMGMVCGFATPSEVEASIYMLYGTDSTGPTHKGNSNQWANNVGVLEINNLSANWNMGYAHRRALNINIPHSYWSRQGGYFSTSDERIKTEIENTETSQALNLVNSITSKSYFYKDILRREKYKTVGYIAQEVFEKIPGAVTLEKGFIPEQYLLKNVNWETIKITDSNNEVKTKYTFTVTDLDVSSNNTGKFRFYVSNDLSGNDEVMKDIQVEADNKTFVFDESWNYVVFYGREVNDFHAIDKNKIFQLHHPAIQQLSKMNDEKTEQIAALQQGTAALQQDNADLRAQLQQIKTHLGLS